MKLFKIIVLLFGWGWLCALPAFSQTSTAPLATKAVAKPAPKWITTRGVSVGRGLKLDIHAPLITKRQGIFRPGKKVPILLYVHGGGWIKGSREKVYRLPSFATSRKWMLVSVDYRPVPRTNIDGQVNDIVRSINWVRKNIKRYGGDPKRIVIMGHSAGFAFGGDDRGEETRRQIAWRYSQ